MTDKDAPPNGSKVFSIPDPQLSVAERELVEKEATAAAEKEEAQEVEAREARARFLGIAPLVGVPDAPEPIMQDGGPSMSPVGLKAEKPKAAAKAATKAKAASKTKTKTTTSKVTESKGIVDETMPGAPDASKVGIAPDA